MRNCKGYLLTGLSTYWAGSLSLNGFQNIPAPCSEQVGSWPAISCTRRWLYIELSCGCSRRKTFSNQEDKKLRNDFKSYRLYWSFWLRQAENIPYWLHFPFNGSSIHICQSSFNQLRKRVWSSLSASGIRSENEYSNSNREILGCFPDYLFSVPAEMGIMLTAS